MSKCWNAGIVLGAAAFVAGAVSAEEILYNGIRLPSPWPPKNDSLTLEPTVPPYLVSPPAVISVDVGRQLFVDDFLIERTTLQRTFHLPEYHAQSPVLQPDRPWETGTHGQSQGPMAMPFSDGVWHDPKDNLFKMWYHADYGKHHLCYATSRDGVHWEKPDLDVVPGTNIVFRSPGGARVVWLDLEEQDPSRRHKLIITRGGEDLLQPSQEWYGSRCSMFVHFSSDGIHWGEPVVRTGPCGDRNSAFWNPFRKVWVYSIREYSPFGGHEGPMRYRRYWESRDLIRSLPWKYREPPLWVGADRHDLRRANHKTMQPELYNLDAVGYESVLLGLFSILRANANKEIGRPKINEVCVGFSRDGFHWHRPDRRSFLPVSERQGDWNWGNVQSAGGGCLAVRDKLCFYVSGRKGDHPHFHDAGCNAGLATLRRDGFASMDAEDQEGTLTTRPVRFSGTHCFVNADVKSGELRVEIIGENGQAVSPFSRDNAAPIREDRTLQPVHWQGAEDLSALVGRPVRFRFHLTNGRLYAFWMSPDASGASHGYVAAGGPGFTGPTDTVGAAALR